MMIELVLGCVCPTGFSIDMIPANVLTGPQNITPIFAAMDPDKFCPKQERDRRFAYLYDKFHAGRKRPGVEKYTCPGSWNGKPIWAAKRTASPSPPP